jgi:hypothetical protein
VYTNKGTYIYLLLCVHKIVLNRELPEQELSGRVASASEFSRCNVRMYYYYTSIREKIKTNSALCYSCVCNSTPCYFPAPSFFKFLHCNSLEGFLFYTATRDSIAEGRWAGAVYLTRYLHGLLTLSTMYNYERC